MLRLLKPGDITNFSNTSRCIYSVAVALRKGENPIKEYTNAINDMLTKLDLSEFRKGSIASNADDDISISFSDMKTLTTTYTLPNICGRCEGKNNCKSYKSSKYSQQLQKLLLHEM